MIYLHVESKNQNKCTNKRKKQRVNGKKKNQACRWKSGFERKHDVGRQQESRKIKLLEMYEINVFYFFSSYFF